MWIIQELKKVTLWNKRHFEEEKTESVQHVSNIHYVYLLNKYIKCNIWRLAVRYDIHTYKYIYIYVIRRLKFNNWAFIYRWLQIINGFSPFFANLISQPLLWGSLWSTIDGPDVWAPNQVSKLTCACPERCRYPTKIRALTYYVRFFFNP